MTCQMNSSAGSFDYLAPDGTTDAGLLLPAPPQAAWTFGQGGVS